MPSRWAPGGRWRILGGGRNRSSGGGTPSAWSWNRLTHVVHCKLKPGAPLAIGPTQSVARQTCNCSAADRRAFGDGVEDAHIADDKYPADDATLQVYINVRAAGQPDSLMTCDKPMPWDET